MIFGSRPFCTPANQGSNKYGQASLQWSPDETGRQPLGIVFRAGQTCLLALVTSWECIAHHRRGLYLEYAVKILQPLVVFSIYSRSNETFTNL